MNTPQFAYTGCSQTPVLLHSGVHLKKHPRLGDVISFEDRVGLAEAVFIAICQTRFHLDPTSVWGMREFMGLTQDELGALLGYEDGQQIAKWEHGKLNKYDAQREAAFKNAFLEHVKQPLKPLTEITGAFEGELEFEFSPSGWSCIAMGVVHSQDSDCPVDELYRYLPDAISLPPVINRLETHVNPSSSRGFEGLAA